MHSALRMQVGCGLSSNYSMPGYCCNCRCAEDAGGVVIAWVNVDAVTSFAIEVSFMGGPQPEHWQRPEAGAEPDRLEYHFTPANGNLLGRVLALNGLPLVATGDTPPPLVPILANASEPLLVAPMSFGYAVVFPQATATGGATMVCQ